MAELSELERRLTALRGELAEMSRQGCTPTQFLKLQRDLVHAWAAVEEHKCQQLPITPSAEGGGETSQTIVTPSHPPGTSRRR